MNGAIKRVFIGTGAFLLLLLATFFTAGIFYPDRLIVKRSRIIDAPKEVVKKRLTDLQGFPAWSPWAPGDTGVEYRYKGKRGEPGSKVIWEEDARSGKGSYTLDAIEGDSIHLVLEFHEPHESKLKPYYALSEEKGGTRVTWGFRESLSWPTNAIPHFMEVDKSLGMRFEEGLMKLDSVLSMPEGGKDGP